MLTQAVLMIYFFSHNEPAYGAAMGAVLFVSGLITVIQTIIKVANQ